MIKFGTVRQVGEERVSRDHRATIPRGQSSSIPKFFGILPMPIRFDLELLNLVYYSGVVFLGGYPCPHPNGAGLQRPPNVWDLLHALTQYEKRQPNFAW